MKTSEKIINYVTQHKEVSANELTNYIGISSRSIFKQLANMLSSGKLIKLGTPPKVLYKIPVKVIISQNEYEIDNKIKKIIEDNFLNISPLGEYIKGLSGFIKWCNERHLDVIKQTSQYFQIINSINESRKNGVIDASSKFSNSFSETFLNKIFYIDFYSIPQFGKTKLGQLLLYAKQSQDKKRISEISNLVINDILKVIKINKIDAVGFIPPTVKREVQFMRELEKNLKLPLPVIKLAKLKTEIIVPQKTLSKLTDRVINARNTIIVEEKRKFKNVLLIDDAVGSGATLNETARKLISNKNSGNIYGLAIIGSYKGFDVISEV